MATRFYLPSSGTAAVSPNYDANWDDTSIAARLPLVTSKTSTSMTTVSKDGDTDAGDTDHLYRQWVSAPLAAQTIAAQSIELQIRAMEENARANQYVAMSVRVVSNDGSTVRGTLLALTRDDTEIFASTTILVNRRLTATTSALDVSANDRIVVEIGTGGDPSTGAGGDSHDADLRVGDASANDLPEDDSEAVNDYNPWVEFANTLTFAGASVSGALAVTLAGMTSTAAGVSTIEGALDTTLAAMALTSAAVSTIVAAADITLDGVTAEAAGTSDISAALDATLDGLTLTSAGTSEVVGTLAVTLDGLTISATGEGETESHVIIDIDHETGDLSQYTSTVTDSGDLSVAAGAALAGTGYGLSCLIDDTTAIYGAYTVSPANTSGVLRVRFYVDPNGLTMADGNLFDLMGCINTAAGFFVYVQLYYTTAAGYQIRAVLVTDSSAEIVTSFYAITDAPHYIELNLIRATNSSASDGSLQLWIDGTSKETLSGRDNYDRFARLDIMRFGAIANLDAGTSGTFYLDELIVNDDGSEIGPVAAAGVNGELDITLDGLTVSATGVSTIEAELDQTLDGLTLGSAGSSTVEAELDQTLDGLTLTGIGASEITAALDATLDDLSISATGTLTVTTYGALDVTLDGLTIAAAGVSTVDAELNTTLDGLTVASEATSDISAALAVTLDGLTLSGAGVSPIDAALDAQLDGISLSATGTTGAAPTYGALDVTLDGISIAAVGVSPVAGALNVSLDGLTVLSAGVAPVVGALNVTLVAITLYATGHVPSLGTGGRPVNYVRARGDLATRGVNPHNVPAQVVLNSNTRDPLYVSDLEVDEL